jgi:hypothetical protein
MTHCRPTPVNLVLFARLNSFVAAAAVAKVNAKQGGGIMAINAAFTRRA